MNRMNMQTFNIANNFTTLCYITLYERAIIIECTSLFVYTGESNPNPITKSNHGRAVTPARTSPIYGNTCMLSKLTFIYMKIMYRINTFL